MPLILGGELMETILEVNHLTAGYGQSAIIQDVSISAKKGSTVVIVGPNGAGKSTLLKAIVGLLNIFSGEIKLNGEEIRGVKPEKLIDLGMGYVPQNRNVFPSLTVQENLEIGGYLRRKIIKERMEQVYTMFPDLKKAACRQAVTLSGGQRNMLAVGRALMTDPSVLLLDEPTAGLSPSYTKTVWEHILRIAEAGRAVLVVEQNATTALSSADWGYVLAEGRNRNEGPAQELLMSPDIGKMFLGR